jgi:signal peptidase I
MAPTLRAGQIVSVDTTAYAHHPPQHGDIVLFPSPSDASRVFIKRIIAIPGDRLLITNGTVSINGQVIGEPYLLEPWVSDNSWPADGQAVTVPANQYFVMGDNRNHSSDSRSFGFVSLEAIQGKLLP